MSIACPHCTAINTAPAQFCTSCGKALPAAERTGPRAVKGSDLAASGVGQVLQSDVLRKQARSAFAVLLTLGILMLVLGGIITALSILSPDAGASLSDDPEVPGNVILLIVGVINLLLGLGFTGLSIWARFNPLPAAITGLAIYGTLILGNAVLDPRTLTQGILIKIIVIAALIKAVSAGIKHRELQRQMRSDLAA